MRRCRHWCAGSIRRAVSSRRPCDERRARQNAEQRTLTKQQTTPETPRQTPRAAMAALQSLDRQPHVMSKYYKLTLDILIGAVLPVLILKYGTAYMGTLPAYLTAALVPVAWVLLDLFVITRRFNFITTYGGLGAIMRGELALWYVDG